MKKLTVLVGALLLLVGCSKGTTTSVVEQGSEETTVVEHVHNYVKTSAQGTLDMVGHDNYVCECGAMYQDNFDNHCPRSLIIDFARKYLGDETPWLETPKCVIEDTVAETGERCYEVAFNTFRQNDYFQALDIWTYFGSLGNLSCSHLVGSDNNVEFTYTTEHVDLKVEADVVDGIAYVYSYIEGDTAGDTMPFPQGLR